MSMAPRGKQDSTWYSKIGAAVTGRAEDDPGGVAPTRGGKVLCPTPLCQGFDLAEDLEQGLAPGPSASFGEAPAEADTKERRLVVQRNPNRNRYDLMDESGSTLLVAKASPNGTRYDLYTTSKGPGSSLNVANGPAFTLVAKNQDKTFWGLASMRCDQCEFRGRRQCGRKDLAQLSHSVAKIGEGQAFCMDVDLPEARKDGTRAVLCSVCGDPSSQWCQELTTRLPKWNAKAKSLTLDFGGRVSMASAKNFQLEDPAEKGKPRLLFGKVAENRFVLDYRYPLGSVQAFAAALTTAEWK